MRSPGVVRCVRNPASCHSAAKTAWRSAAYQRASWYAVAGRAVAAVGGDGDIDAEPTERPRPTLDGVSDAPRCARSVGPDGAVRPASGRWPAPTAPERG